MKSFAERIELKAFYEDLEALEIMNEAMADMSAFLEKKGDQADAIRSALGGKLSWGIGGEPKEAVGRTKTQDLPDLENKTLTDIEKIFREKAYNTLEKATVNLVNALNNSIMQKNTIPVEKAKTLLKDFFEKKLKSVKTFAKANYGAPEYIRQFFAELLALAKIEQTPELTKLLGQKYDPGTLEKMKDDDFRKDIAPLVYDLSKAYFFAGTLNLRLDAVLEEGFDSYIKKMFAPNSKISKSGKMISQAEADEIVNDINDIRKKRGMKPITFPDKNLQVVTHTFSLPAFQSNIGLKTCTNAGACAEFCYALSGTFQYPNSMAKNEISLMFTLTREFPAKVIEHLSKITGVAPNQTANRDGKLRIVRIHDSGDFYSLKYLSKWLRVIKAFPTVLFYAYTKQLKLSEQELPPNLVITHSLSGVEDKRLLTLIEKGIAIKHSKIFASKKDLKKDGYEDTSDDDKGAMKPGKTKVGLVIHNSDKDKEEKARKMILAQKAKDEEKQKGKEMKGESLANYMEKVVIVKTVEEGKEEKKDCGCGDKCSPKCKAMTMKKKYAKS